jgi:hypothetical protein
MNDEATSGTALAEWLTRQPRGTLARLVRKTGLSGPTVDRAKRGLPVSPDTARLLSEATRGEVLATSIPQVKAGRERFEDDDESVSDPLDEDDGGDGDDEADVASKTSAVA